MPRKQKVVKPAMKWRVPDQTTSKSNTLSFNVKTTTPISTQGTNNLFVFGADAQKVKVSEASRSSKNSDETEPSSKPGKRKETPEKPKPYSLGHILVFGKAQVGSKNSQEPGRMGHTIRKRRKTLSKPRKMSPYVLHDQELKIEESKRAQRKIFNWKRRHQQKLRRNTKVLNVSEFLWKKFRKRSKNKKRRTNKEKQVTTKVMKRLIRTTYMLEKEEPPMFCLEKRQQSSPAVMFARLRSNRRYKPGD